MITHLIWDSDFFGIEIGRTSINTERDVDDLKSEIGSNCPYDLIYIFDDLLTKRPICNAELVDTKIVYRKTIISSAKSVDEQVYQYSEKIPDSSLYDLALISGEYSRYKFDSKLPKGSFERLYRRWIENSVTGEFADVVFCYGSQDKNRGMMTVRCQNEVGQIGLVAVYPDYQGNGIGSILLEATESYLLHRGINTVEVATQLLNEKACHFYEKNGFVKSCSTDIYHLWR